MDNCEPKPGALINILGREEGIEDALHCFFVHATAGVRNSEDNEGARRNSVASYLFFHNFLAPQGDSQVPFLVFHGLECIRAKVYYNLMDIGRIGLNRSAVLIDFCVDSNRGWYGCSEHLQSLIGH